MNEPYKALNSLELQELKDTLEKREQRQVFGKTLASIVRALLVIAAIAVLCATVLVPVFRVNGGSMNPTMEDGQVIISLRNSQFVEGDIIAFYYGNKVLLKRVIAKAGDWVDIDDNGVVSVNGEVLYEPYLSAQALGECNINLPYQVPDGRWFVMGDNRVTSLDSRSTLVGAVAEDQIIGKVVLCVWPISDFGAVQ